MSAAAGTPVTGAPWRLSGFADEVDDDPVVQLAVLEALGIGHVEVRSAWGTNVADMTEEQAAALARLVRERGAGVSAVASPVGKADVGVDVEEEVARLRRCLAVARALGTTSVRVFSFYPPDGALDGDGQWPAHLRDAVLTRMAALAAAAAAEGAVLLHENEKGIYGDTPARCLDLLEAVASPALRAAWDPANFVQVGVTPFDEGWEALRPYVDYLHVKDARLGTGEVTVAGAGDGQWRETLAALRADGWQGFCSLEPHLATAGERSGFSGPTLFHQATEAFVALLDEHDITHDAHPSAAGVIESPGPGQPRGGR